MLDVQDDYLRKNGRLLGKNSVNTPESSQQQSRTLKDFSTLLTGAVGRL
jgi:hypothetical protein